jgi:hypothetical protein
VIDITPLIDEAVQKAIELMFPIIKLETKKALYPKSIKGHEKAAELLDISYSALTKRLERGEYLEGVHYEKKSDRIFLWDRDTLLEAETSKRRKS